MYVLVNSVKQGEFITFFWRKKKVVFLVGRSNQGKNACKSYFTGYDYAYTVHCHEGLSIHVAIYIRFLKSVCTHTIF